METWLAQKECKPPTRANLYFKDWSHKFNTYCEEMPFNPNLPYDLAFDFTNGGESPTVCQFWQQDEQGINYLIASRQYRHMDSQQVAQDIIQFAQDLGIKSSPNLQIGDSAQMQEIRNLNTFNSDFFRIMPTKKITRKEGWPILKRLIKDNTGKRKLMVNERYANTFIIEIEKAMRSRSDPDEIGKRCEDHE